MFLRKAYCRDLSETDGGFKHTVDGWFGTYSVSLRTLHLAGDLNFISRAPGGRGAVWDELSSGCLWVGRLENV